MKFPRGYLKLIAQKAGIHINNISRDLKSKRPKAIEAAKTVLMDKKSDLEAIDSLLAQLQNGKPSKSKKNTTHQSEWYSVDQAATALGISRDTVIRYCKGTGRVKWDRVKKVGRQWRVHQSHIRSY